MARATGNLDHVEAAVVVDREVKERLDPLLAAALLETADGQKLPADRPDKLELRQPHVLEEALLPRLVRRWQSLSARANHSWCPQDARVCLRAWFRAFFSSSSCLFFNPPFILED